MGTQDRTAMDKKTDNSEMLAVITAAIASLDVEPGFRLIVKTFRRTSQVSPVWNTTGRLERFRNKFNS